MSRKIRVGSRDSTLAIKQAQIVMEAIKEKEYDLELELVLIKTTGDKIQAKKLDKIGGKGLFIKELEQALFDRTIDIAVHSYKDMPYMETEGLPVVALSERETPFDALVLPEGETELSASKPVGSSSIRRTIQFSRLYDGFSLESIRGSVPTRLLKLDSGEYAALILAAAGLHRLGLQKRIFRMFSIDEMIPCCSQGILAVQGRQGEDYSYLDRFHNRASEIVSRAERQYLKTIFGGCSSATAAFGLLHNNELLLTGMYGDEFGNIETGKMSGSSDEAESLGERLAKQLKSRLENK